MRMLKLAAVRETPSESETKTPAVRTANDVFTARNIRMEFGEDNPYVALDNLNLDIRHGEFLCLLGASGCGKSTLLNLLAGFEKPTSGDLKYWGLPIAGPAKERVMFFQDANAALLPWLTVQQNVEFGLRLQGIGAQRQAVAGRGVPRTRRARPASPQDAE